MKTFQVKTFYLQMLRRPKPSLPPPVPPVEILQAKQPAIPFYRFLYDAVGRDWNWVDRKRMSDEALGAIIHDDLVEIYVLHVEQAPAGFGELDRRTEGQIELAYFGLMPEFIGKGFGKRFLHWVVQKAWSYGPRRLWLHTCDLDHPAALPVYLEAGFVVFDQRIVDKEI